jgi:CRISPR/Cas system CSM-associated protein Csm4 (group 5 of RAMP superfamily)
MMVIKKYNYLTIRLYLIIFLISFSSTASQKKKMKRTTYFNDFKLADMENTELAKKFFETATSEVNKNKKTIDNLKHQKARLLKSKPRSKPNNKAPDTKVNAYTIDVYFGISSNHYK